MEKNKQRETHTVCSGAAEKSLTEFAPAGAKKRKSAFSGPLWDTRSVCPLCLLPIPAALELREDGAVWQRKSCPEHGAFATPVWRGKMDFLRWTAGASRLPAGAGLGCPANCGLCPEHEQATCCSLLEVTARCNLRCRFCFASAGEDPAADPPLSELKAAVDDIMDRCGRPLLQLSGGEPTLRDDLPELVAYAKERGCPYVQVNTNGLRLAREPAYAAALAQAGVSIVFLQFDGVDDAVYEALRGRPLLAEKEAAIAVCRDLRMGVTLVPTVVRGVNDGQLGDIVRYAAARLPGVRAVHFQPVSYFGRIPTGPEADGRFTLDELMAGLVEQAGLPEDSFLPSRCDHPLCGFHAAFLAEADGTLRPLHSRGRSGAGSQACRTTAEENRSYVARHWERRDTPEDAGKPEDDSFEGFIRRMRTRTLTLTSMAFQDAGNLDIERLHRCSLHVYDKGRVVPFCAKYLSALPGKS